MRKLIPILFCLFCMVGSTVHAGLSMRIDSLGISVNDKLGIPREGNDKIADSIRNYAINEAVLQICTEMPAYEKCTTLVTGNRIAPLPSDYSHFNFALRMSSDDGSIYPLEPLHPSQWFVARGEEAGSVIDYQQEDRPRNFWIHADSLMLYPFPSATDTIQLAYYAIDSTLNVDASVCSVDPAFRDAIVTLATFKLLSVTSRLVEAKYYLDLYTQMKAQYNVKE